MKYYVDYFDYYLSGLTSGYRMKTRNREKRLLFDLLCIDPKQDIFVFTLTETLLEDSNAILVKYVDFWKNGVFKIALASKYRTAMKYVDDRLGALYDNFGNIENFEIGIYQSDITYGFLKEFLVDDLKLRGNNTFILHRESDADSINRHLLLDKVTNLDYMNEGLKSILSTDEIDKVITTLSDRAKDKSVLFQRGYILNELFCQYPDLNRERLFFYKLFDTNYNNAMAQAVGAVRLSQIKSRLTAVSLEFFMRKLDVNLYKELSTLTPHQLYILTNTDDWQVYVGFISSLFSLLYNYKEISQDEMFTYFKKYYLRKQFAINSIIDILLLCVSKLDYPEFMLKDDLKRGKQYLIEFLHQHGGFSDQVYSLASEIHKRTPSIQLTVNNIKMRNG